MVKISATGNTPLEALSSLTAFGMHCMQNADICAAASRILEAEKHEEKKLAAAQAQAAPAEAHNGANAPAPEEEPISDTPKVAPAPTAASGPADGPADGANGQTAAPGDKPEPVPTVEQVRAKGIEASRKYGKEAVVAILQKFRASGMSAIAEKDRAAFLTELEGLGEGNA